MATLDVIIVNWNAGAQLRDCLASLAGSSWDGFEIRRVVVVDNASEDDSIDGLDALNLPLHVIRNVSNRGFAAACNQGAADSEADYLLFLNPDTRVLPGSLSKSVLFMEDPVHKQVGLLGAQLVDETGGVSRTCATFPELSHFLARMTGLDRLLPRYVRGYMITDWDHATSRPVDHVMGAYFLTRRSLFEDLGGFDERFFVYLEDLDYARRVHESGWQTYFLADAQVYHKGCGTSEQIKGRRLFYALQSQILYGFKHFGSAAAMIHLAGVLSVEWAARLGRSVIRRSADELRATLQAYRLLWGALPRILATARQSRAVGIGPERHPLAAPSRT
jgi:N-acetylglucosaminyl-diphospho-decaprenol L-rhamnosyltransferase